MKTIFVIFGLLLITVNSAYAASAIAVTAVGAITAGADASIYGANCATGKCQSALISKQISDEIAAEEALQTSTNKKEKENE